MVTAIAMASIPEKRISLPFLFLRKEKFTVVRLGLVNVESSGSINLKINPVVGTFRKFEF